MKRLFSILVLLTLLPFPTPAQVQAQAVNCSQFDVWIWAQTVFESNKAANANLDPDGNGLACEHLPFVGFAPLTGVDVKPKNIFPVTSLKVIGADKLTVKSSGISKTILLHESRPLVMPNGQNACGATQSQDFMKWVLSWVDPKGIYVEPNYGTMADYSEHQGYLWMEIAGDWYMLNEVMIRSGWAGYSDEGWHHLHKNELTRAESFATQHMLGANLTCGGTNLAPGSTPNGDQLAQASTVQPNHGQVADATNYYTTFLAQAGPHGEQAKVVRNNVQAGNSSETQTNADTESQPVQSAGIVYQPPAEAVVEQPVQEVYIPPAEAVVEQPASTGCHPSYGACLPIVGDLNCGDIWDRGFWADASDPYGLDSDSDGIACEN